jgi:hypothetical protein
MMDHRLDRRVPMNIPVRLSVQDGTAGFGVALNISRGGIYVRTAAPWRSGCVDVRMRVMTPAGERTALLPGLIVHGDGEGIGLMFRQLDRRSESVVTWLVRNEALPTGPGGLPSEQPPIPTRSGVVGRHD